MVWIKCYSRYAPTIASQLIIAPTEWAQMHINMVIISLNAKRRFNVFLSIKKWRHCKLFPLLRGGQLRPSSLLGRSLGEHQTLFSGIVDVKRLMSCGRNIVGHVTYLGISWSHLLNPIGGRMGIRCKWIIQVWKFN